MMNKKEVRDLELKHRACRDGRLSSFLKEEMGMSTGLVNRLKWQERLFVNEVACHTDYPVKTGDVIRVTMDEPEPAYPAEDGPLDIIWEDDYFLAVDKPAGMLIHPSRSRNNGTLANRVVGYYQRTGQASAFHPVTRLDRDTFGLVLLAKSSHAHAKMQAASTEKFYHAWVLDCPEETEGEISAPIMRCPLPSLLRMVHPEGKPSLTRYRVLERREGCSLLELEAVTGRTHQLRLHCAHIGHPILGDPQYFTAQSAALSGDYGLQTQLLCAQRLVFSHPITGEAIVLESGVDTRQLLNKM